jgi:uncharacterized protein (DUF1330 family)
LPKGYFFVELEIADPAAYEAYRTAVSDIIADHGGRILVGKIMSRPDIESIIKRLSSGSPPPAGPDAG